MEPTQTIEDLGKKVKAKYAGVYDDLPDEEVGKRVKQKFPSAYSDFRDLSYGEKPQFKASMAGASSIVPNVAKTFGNLPSSAAHIVDTTVQSTAGNIGKSIQATQDIYKNRGFVQGTKDIASGFADTGKKIFEAPGKFLVGSNDKANLVNKLSPIQEQALKLRDTLLEHFNEAAKIGDKARMDRLSQAIKLNQEDLDSLNQQIDTKENRAMSGVNTISNIAKYPIERPSDVVLGLYGGESAAGKDAISEGGQLSNYINPVRKVLGKEPIAPLNTELSNVIPKMIPDAITPDAASMMQKVARIPKGAQAKFKQISGGESVGDYLVNRGIYGNEEKIASQLYDRFQTSKTVADEALASLPGIHQAPPIKTALDELVAREGRVSSPGAPSADLRRTNELANRYQTQGGLSMSEINEVKRLYERNVKLDFLKSQQVENVARANNIDNAIRNWQFKKAENLGLKNLPEINKETQLSKQLLNNLEKESAGKAGNDAISLTDWILLSHGNPEAIASYFLKKGFFNKTVQSRIAKLVGPEASVGIPEARFGGKQGLPSLIPGRDYGTTIEMRAPKSPTSFEAPSQKINRTSSLSEQKLLPAGGKSQGKSIILPRSIYETNLGLDEVRNINRQVSPSRTTSATEELGQAKLEKSYNQSNKEAIKATIPPNTRTQNHSNAIAPTNFSTKKNTSEKLIPKPIPQPKTAVNAELSTGGKSKIPFMPKLKNSGETPFTTPAIRQLTESEKPILQKVNSVLEGKSSHEVIGDTPGFVSADGKERPIIFSKASADKIQSTHGKPSPENLVINANDWDGVLKNVKPQSGSASAQDKVNFLKKIPGTDNILLIGANRDNGFYIVTHYEIVPKAGNEIKSLLGRGDLLSSSGSPLAPKDFLDVPSAQGSFKGVSGNVDTSIIPKPKNSVNTTVGKKPVPFLPKKNMKTDFNSPTVGQTAYRGETDLTTKVLKNLEGKTTVSKQSIVEALNNKDIKPAERSLIGDILSREKETVNVPEFAKKVKAELLPLKINPKEMKFPEITLPEEMRGSVKSYKDRIYESPIKTSAGDKHFPGTSDSYFGHTSIEDMADGKTRRVLQVQSDLYQKGNKAEQVGKLEQYNNPSAHFRLIREEIKKAAEDGKTKLQFPTGKTIMDIEGLGKAHNWSVSGTKLNPEMLKVGKQISDGGKTKWIITDVLEDGKFKAIAEGNKSRPRDAQIFDVSDKVDTSNRIYRFYEKDIQKYLDKFGGKKIIDGKGVNWIEVPIKKEYAKQPIQAFGKIMLSPLFLGAGASALAVGASKYYKNKIPFLPEKRK